MDPLRQERGKLSREARRSVGKELRGVYHDLAGRPLPARLLELLRRLERGNAASAVASSHQERSAKHRGGERWEETTKSYFNAVIDFVGSHPQVAGCAGLLLALSEAIPVIGTVVPGSTLILAISALATTADVKPWLLLAAAVLGAIAGDGLSFWLGYRYRREILRGWPLNRFPRFIARSTQ